MKWIFWLFFSSSYISAIGQIYSSVDNSVNFVSDAPLEIIKARSDGLQGVLDLANKAFAFQVNIKTFQGFNSPLQQIHFYENYLETERHPLAVFKGKLIENIAPANRTYRAKGILEIHGIQREVIIPVDIILGEKQIQFSTEFTVLIADYNIEIPRIVYQKIAELIKIQANGKLTLRE